MNPTPEIKSEHRPRHTLTAIARSLVYTIAVTVAAAISAHGYTTYSGASVGDNGTVYGWGVTDAYFSGMVHTAYVTTTFSSPHRSVYSGERNAITNVRADLSLPWDPNDLGTYYCWSSHRLFCWTAFAYFQLPPSQGSTTVPSVTLTLRTGGTVSPDNGGRDRYIYYVGYDALGSFFSQGADPNAWRTGVEIIGTVSPSFCTGTITLQRKIIDARWYIYNGPDPYDSWSNVADTTPDALLRDDNPQSGNSSGKVYDLDAPFVASGSNNPPDFVWRRRTNFRQWATLPNGTVVSGNLYWYSRHSIIKKPGGDQKETTVPNDNMAGLGTTSLRWDLQ